jgi:hypothetical protein
VNENTHDTGESTIGGQVPTTGATVRHNARGSGGRFKPRESRIVGPLNKPEGPGGIDNVSGRFIPGVRNNAQLHDYERMTVTTTRPVYEARDWSQGVHPDRKSHDGVREFGSYVNHLLDCPGC